MPASFSSFSEEDFSNLAANPLFQKLLDALSIGISLTDSSGTIRFFSNPCYEIHGIPRSESVVGQKIDAVFSTGKAGVLDSLKTRQINTLNGLYKDVEALTRRSPITDESGKLIGCITEVLVTTLQKQRIDELLKSIQELKAKVDYYATKCGAGKKLCSFDGIVGETSAMREVKALGRRFAQSSEPVLILGESGTGKELFAQAVHQAGEHADGAFVSVNCAALPRELAESELFGYEDGAFTGAHRGGQKGKFEAADNGTIFLDEIAELPRPLQAKLLRVLESREIQKIGTSNRCSSNFRLIAATNRDLAAMVRQGQFRDDLYHRLSILELPLPPLRRHRADIPRLLPHLLENICGPQRALEVSVSPEVLELFMRYDWPGNVRELKNVLAYAYCLMNGESASITPDYLPARFLRVPPLSGSGADGKETAEEDASGILSTFQVKAERRAIEAALARAGGNKSRAARALGISRNTLYLKLKAFGMTGDVA